MPSPSVNHTSDHRKRTGQGEPSLFGVRYGFRTGAARFHMITESRMPDTTLTDQYHGYQSKTKVDEAVPLHFRMKSLRFWAVEGRY